MRFKVTHAGRSGAKVRARLTKSGPACGREGDSSRSSRRGDERQLQMRACVWSRLLMELCQTLRRTTSEARVARLLHRPRPLRRTKKGEARFEVGVSVKIWAWSGGTKSAAPTALCRDALFNFVSSCRSECQSFQRRRQAAFRPVLPMKPFGEGDTLIRANNTMAGS